MQGTERRIIIIPDVHGRDFWKEAVRGRETGEIVFLGDYTDPYGYEGIPQEKGLAALREVIAFKKAHPGNVTLLLGNHDLGYLDRSICRCRMDYMNEGAIQHELVSNLELFDLVKVAESDSRRYLFSHAGLGTGWIESWPSILRRVKEDPAVLNDFLHGAGTRPMLLRALRDVSYMRGGDEPYGSCVWADCNEYSEDNVLLEGYFHVFGHTQGDGPRQVSDRGVCLDCRRAFTLDLNAGDFR